MKSEQEVASEVKIKIYQAMQNLSTVHLVNKIIEETRLEARNSALEEASFFLENNALTPDGDPLCGIWASKSIRQLIKTEEGK